MWQHLLISLIFLGIQFQYHYDNITSSGSCFAFAFAPQPSIKSITTNNVHFNEYHNHVQSQSLNRHQSLVILEQTRTQATDKYEASSTISSWLPPHLLEYCLTNTNDNSNETEEDYTDDDKVQLLEERSIQYLTNIIQTRLQQIRENKAKNPQDGENDDNDQKEKEDNQEQPTNLAIGRFQDLTCNIRGAQTLEELFSNPSTVFMPKNETDIQMGLVDETIIIRASIVALQSLLILGTQVGVKGPPQALKRMVNHLDDTYNDDGNNSSSNNNNNKDDKDVWNAESIRRLKHKVDTTAAIQLLAKLKRKRNTQSAFDLLVQLGVWTQHEDLALLRSGFPTHHTTEELEDAQLAVESTHDPDQILGLRKDLRFMKVYTIDAKTAKDIDDGLSVEYLNNEDDDNEEERIRIWIHIADADRWSPRDSKIFQAAQRRITSLYLPTQTIPMFPDSLSAGVMSLGPNQDSHALSLGVMLNKDGSIDAESLIITPSIINVGNYRLTYDEVDEMLDYGIAYFEEKELGALLGAANKRREFRIQNGSTEGFVPNPIPQAEVKVKNVPIDPTNNDDDVEVEDLDSAFVNLKGELDITIKVEATHNSGQNSSATVSNAINPSKADEHAAPLSSATLLVTEMMIMAGEAMGKLKSVLATSSATDTTIENELILPYRTQAKADFSQRYQELNTFESLRNKGYGYCHAWYARRFFEPVKVLEDALPHTGLGLDCYVQWSSPIRRFSDLQVHAAVKRYLRRRRVNALMKYGREIPQSLTASDLGCPVPMALDDSIDAEGKYTKYDLRNTPENKEDYSINYKKGVGFFGAARTVQRKSKEYWMFEYLKRRKDSSSEDVVYEAVVLACVDPKRKQFAIYIHELGLEHRYLSEKGFLQAGETIWLKLASTTPHYGLLAFTLAKF